MNIKLLLGISLLSVFSMSCELEEEMVQPKSVTQPQIAISNNAYVTSADPNRKNLIAEEIFEPAMSDVFRKQIYSSYGMGVTNSLARNGSNALRLELRNEGSVVRSEILYGKPVPAEGWHGISLYLPSNSWQTDNDSDAWAIITQFHGTPDSGDGKRVPAIALSVIKGQLILAVSYSAKRYNTTPDGKARFDLGPVVKDKWLDFVYHIKHSYRSDGKLELWMNGKKVVNYNGPNTYNDAETPYLKMGVYKRNWTKATNKNVIFVDDVRMAGSNATYNDVASKGSSVVTPPPPVADTTKTSVTQPLSLVLMNADTQQPIQTLTTGTILDLAKLPTRNLNVLAISSKTIGSVGFNLTGAQTNSSSQTTAPYSLFGDTGGKVLPWTFVTGNYSLTATSYSGINATGTAGPPLTVSFQVIDQVITPPVENVPPTATLVINNDAIATASASVTLNITAAGATQMRFYDDNDKDVWGSWEPIATTKNWVLSSGSGPKWVKVQVRNAAGQESEEWFDTITLQ